MALKTIVISKSQYETIEGISNYISKDMCEISERIIKYGLEYLIALSLEKKGGEENKYCVEKLVNTSKENPHFKKFSENIAEFTINVEDKKSYIRKKGFFSWLPFYTIDVSDKQKLMIHESSKLARLPERLCNMFVYGAGMSFMLIAVAPTTETVEYMKNDYMKSKSMMKLADGLRKTWEKEKIKKNKE